MQYPGARCRLNRAGNGALAARTDNCDQALLCRTGTLRSSSDEPKLSLHETGF